MKLLLQKVLYQSKNFLRNQFKNIDFNSFLQKIPPFFFKYKRWIITVIVTIALADLFILFIWPFLLPQSTITSTKPKTISVKQKANSSSSNFIHTANIFHSGPIPPPLSELERQEEPTFTGESKKTNLPFKLLGTIENFNPKRSMASIQVTPGETNSYFVGDTIDNKARVTQIQRRKVIFMNLINNQMEHLEIPIEESLFNVRNKTGKIENQPLKQPKTKPITHKGISKTNNNQYSVTRSSLNEYLQQLPDILQQARVEPKYGTDGKVLGHTFTWMEEGSIFESLGFVKGDMLISVNGEKVNNDMEAQKLFQQFRADSQFSIVVESENGETREISYNINEDTSVQ
ncbi:MAG: hypothetical protein OXK80_01745 [Bdellovibrionales bacterium]|nr:hypothetical protein [Bdellovibrionales bacterium]